MWLVEHIRCHREKFQIEPGSADIADPSQYALSTWAREFTGLLWYHQYSLGLSGNHRWAELTDSSTDPSVGTAVNGHSTADFDGTSDLLKMLHNSTERTLTHVISSNSWAFSALVYVDAIASNSATAYLNDCLIGDTGNKWGIFLRNNAGTKTVIAYQDDGAAKTASATVATGALTLIQARYDGTNIEVRVDGGAWTSTLAGSVSSLAGNPRLGGLTGFFNGRIVDEMTAKVNFDDTVMDDLKSYINSRYGTAF